MILRVSQVRLIFAGVAGKPGAVAKTGGPRERFGPHRNRAWGDDNAIEHALALSVVSAPDDIAQNYGHGTHLPRVVLPGTNGF